MKTWKIMKILGNNWKKHYSATWVKLYPPKPLKKHYHSKVLRRGGRKGAPFTKSGEKWGNHGFSWKSPKNTPRGTKSHLFGGKLRLAAAPPRNHCNSNGFLRFRGGSIPSKTAGNEKFQWFSSHFPTFHSFSVKTRKSQKKQENATFRAKMGSRGLPPRPPLIKPMVF